LRLRCASCAGGSVACCIIGVTGRPGVHPVA
jgi:hypothetical protein